MGKKILYSEALKKKLVADQKKDKSVKELKKLEKLEELEKLEKVLYSKECVAQSIKFVVGRAIEDNTLKGYKRFSCSLTTILARDKEAVAVRLKIFASRCLVYLAKNFGWNDEDINYIDKIENYLKKMSSSAPNVLKDVELAFISDVALFCSTRLRSRLEKLVEDIRYNCNSEHVKCLISLTKKVHDIEKASTASVATMLQLSLICNKFYREVRNNTMISPKFLGHIKKMGSYVASIIDILECAHNARYKTLFANVRISRGQPVIINEQPIYSWENIIKRFIDDDDYNLFMDKCLKKDEIKERMNKVYMDKATKQQQQLDGNDVKQQIYLHAEMNIVSLLIRNKIQTREFIAVSKRCCYLCELYIEFARKSGYKIFVPGKHKKIYSGWKLPRVSDIDFEIKSVRYILGDLDRIIDNKIKHYTSSLQASSDSGAISPKRDQDNKGEFFKGYLSELRQHEPNSR